MEKNTQKINLFFILCILVFLSIIICFNYYIDPYNVFEPSLKINEYLNDDPFMQIKLSKKNKYQYAITGGSNIRFIHLEDCNKKLADISVYKVDLHKIETILLYYLEIHPETKTVFFPIDYQLFEKSNRKTVVSKYNSKHLTIKEFYRLFLSIQTTKKSIEKILNLNKNEHNKTIKVMIAQERETKTIAETKTKENIEQLEENSIIMLDRIFSELKERNVEIICFTPPYHANYQYFLHKRYNKQLDNIKRYVIKEQGKLIDMALINEYTTEPFEKSQYFIDKFHPSEKYSKYIYDILFNSLKNSPTKNLYVVLTKDNLEKEIKKHNKDINKYYNNNKEEYIKFTKQSKF